MDEPRDEEAYMKKLIRDAFETGFRKCGEMAVERVTEFKEYVVTSTPPATNPLQEMISPHVKAGAVGAVEQVLKIVTEVTNVEIIAHVVDLSDLDVN